MCQLTSINNPQYNYITCVHIFIPQTACDTEKVTKLHKIAVQIPWKIVSSYEYSLHTCTRAVRCNHLNCALTCTYPYNYNNYENDNAM